MEIPNCPKCDSAYTYEDRNMYVCPICAYEWNEIKEEFIVFDSNNNVLKDGDAVCIIKDLKVKGSSNALKRGTKVKNIKLVNKDHNIDCKIEGFGQMGLKSEFVKKI